MVKGIKKIFTLTSGVRHLMRPFHDVSTIDAASGVLIRRTTSWAVTKRWGSCLTASLRFGGNFNLVDGRIYSKTEAILRV
jgi:hypothetical protein